jgi:hypothetical protein
MEAAVGTAVEMSELGSGDKGLWGTERQTRVEVQRARLGTRDAAPSGADALQRRHSPPELFLDLDRGNLAELLVGDDRAGLRSRAGPRGEVDRCRCHRSLFSLIRATELQSKPSPCAGSLGGLAAVDHEGGSGGETGLVTQQEGNGRGQAGGGAVAAKRDTGCVT